MRGCFLVSIALAVLGCERTRYVRVPGTIPVVTKQLRDNGYARPDKDEGPRPSPIPVCEDNATTSEIGCRIGVHEEVVWVEPPEQPSWKNGFESRAPANPKKRSCDSTAVAYADNDHTVLELVGCEELVDKPYRHLPSTTYHHFESWSRDHVRLMPYLEYGLGQSPADDGVDHRWDFGLGAAFSIASWGDARPGAVGWRHDLWLGAGVDLALSAPGNVARPYLSLAYSHRHMTWWKPGRRLDTSPTFIYELAVSRPMFMESGYEVSLSAPFEVAAVIARVSWAIEGEPGVAWTIGLRLPLFPSGINGGINTGGLGGFGTIFRAFTFRG